MHAYIHTYMHTHIDAHVHISYNHLHAHAMMNRKFVQILTTTHNSKALPVSVLDHANPARNPH